MSNKPLKSSVDDMNIEISLFINEEGKACIRGRDLDVEENFFLSSFPSLEDADKFYEDQITINPTRKISIPIV
jgi:hypothetical protein